MSQPSAPPLRAFAAAFDLRGGGGVRHDASEYFEAGVTPGSELLEVWLDGARLPGCVKAHRGQSWATCYRTAPDGRVLLDYTGAPLEDFRYGAVEFRCCNDDPFRRPAGRPVARPAPAAPPPADERRRA